MELMFGLHGSAKAMVLADYFSETGEHGGHYITQSAIQRRIKQTRHTSSWRQGGSKWPIALYSEIQGPKLAGSVEAQWIHWLHSAARNKLLDHRT